MLFRKKIERSCAYCANGARLGGGQILCAKKGLKTVDDQCRKFKYDPCKPKAVDFSKYDNEDFSL